MDRAFMITALIGLPVLLLIWLALRGVNIIFASVLCSLVVIVTNGLPLAQGLGEYYSFGSLGAFTTSTSCAIGSKSARKCTELFRPSTRWLRGSTPRWRNIS